MELQEQLGEGLGVDYEVERVTEEGVTETFGPTRLVHVWRSTSIGRRTDRPSDQETQES